MSTIFPEGTFTFCMHVGLGTSAVWAIYHVPCKYKLYIFSLRIMAAHSLVGVYKYVHPDTPIDPLISPRTDFFIRYCSTAIAAGELFHQYGIGSKDLYWHQLACGAGPFVVYACREPQSEVLNDFFLAFNVISMFYIGYFTDCDLPFYLGICCAMNFKLLPMIADYYENVDKNIYLLGMAAFNYLTVQCLNECEC